MDIEFEKMIDYNPDTGKMYWRVTVGRRAKAGAEIGGINRHGYRKVKIKGRMYLVHRLVWKLAYGVWPANDIDHFDGDRLNNRLSNLRDVTRAINVRNSRRRVDNSSGIVGVSQIYHPTKFWAAQWFDEKKKSKWFSVAKHGEEAAKQMAIDYRAARIKELGGYTERHGT
jgi:hypothetical protein